MIPEHAFTKVMKPANKFVRRLLLEQLKCEHKTRVRVKLKTKQKKNVFFLKSH